MVLTSAVKDAAGKYELIVPYPSHFLTGGSSLLIKHPTTRRLTSFYTASDGFLHEGSPTGPRLPQFGSRGEVDRDITLNPILVNFAAAIRLSYLDRQTPGWRESLDAEAKRILDEVENLHRAVIWEPGQVLEQSSETPAQPSSPSLGAQQKNLPTMSWEDAMKLMHTGTSSSSLLRPTIF